MVHYLTYDGSYEAEFYTDIMNVTLGHHEFLVEQKWRKIRQKIRPIDYKFMRLWLQELALVTTITCDMTKKSCEVTSISCEIIGLQFHATVSGWYTQQIYASNFWKKVSE